MVVVVGVVVVVVGAVVVVVGAVVVVVVVLVVVVLVVELVVDELLELVVVVSAGLSSSPVTARPMRMPPTMAMRISTTTIATIRPRLPPSSGGCS